jgi:hypothetical protein
VGKPSPLFENPQITQLMKRTEKMKVLQAVWNYLKDWKNLLTHGLIGVGIVVVALVIPVAPIYRLVFLVLAVGFNLIRMNHSKRFLPANK